MAVSWHVAVFPDTWGFDLISSLVPGHLLVAGVTRIVVAVGENSKNKNWYLSCRAAFFDIQYSVCLCSGRGQRFRGMNDSGLQLQSNGVC